MYHFIVNPNSRSGKSKEIWKNVKKKLDEEHIEYRAYFTKYQRHATKIAAQITSDGQKHIIVAMGGDGTIGEVANGLCYPEKVTLGYIPVGSGNDFARGLHFPNDWEKALDIILHPGNIKKLNLCCLEYKDKRRRFVVSSGFGYDAAICHQSCVSKFKKVLNRLNLGKLAYVVFSLDRLYHAKPDEMTIILDDTRKLHFNKTYFTCVQNLPYEGGGCKFCPDAKSDDDLLDLIVVADVRKYWAFPILLTVFWGKHKYLKGVHLYKCKKAEMYSSVPLPLHTDGEPIFLQRKLRYSLEETSAKIMLP